jgi:diguanylate cyclase (GGDEF)-like protein/PAS domain S-box-containing protein
MVLVMVLSFLSPCTDRLAFASRYCKQGLMTSRLFLLLAVLYLPSVALAASTLEQWRTEANSTRTLADNDAPRAYAQAQRLQADLPTDATAVDRARILNLLARIEAYLALTPASVKHTQQALALAKQSADRVGQAEAYLTQVFNTVNQGDLKGLVAATNQSLAVLEGVDRPDLLGEALLRNAMKYLREGQLEASVTLTMQAMDIARRVNNPLALTYAHQGLGISYQQSERFAEARGHYLQMLEQARAAHSKLLEATALDGLGDIANRLGAPRDGEQLVREAEVLFRAVGAPFSISVNLYTLALNLTAQGRLKEATAALNEVITIYERYPNRIGLWYALNARSSNYQSLGNANAAQADTLRAYGLAKEIDFPIYLSDSTNRMAAVAAANGDYRKAFQLALEARAMADKVMRQKGTERMMELAQRYQSESKQREIDELTRRNEQQTAELQRREMQGRWLQTLLGGGALVFFGTVYFLLRLRRSHRLLETLNTQVQASQNKLQATLDAIPDLLFEIGLDGRYYDVHSPHVEWLIAPSEGLIGTEISETLPPHAVATCLSALHEAHETGGSSGKQFDLELPQGKLWFELSVSRKPTEQGQTPRFIVLSRNVTERKHTEEALRIAATAFESQEGMSITDAQGVILQVNKAFTTITGYTAEEVVGHNPRLLKSERQDSDFYSAMWDSIVRTGSWQGEIWNRRKNGDTYPVLLSISAVKDKQEIVTHYVGAFVDITHRKEAENEIRNLAFFDLQTGLPNRRLLLDRMELAISGRNLHPSQRALLLIDLDNFKSLNDTLGHDKGDLLLQQVALRLTACTREGDTVARLGGDEFVVMLENLSESQDEAAVQAEAVGNKILTSFEQSYSLAGYEHHSTASIGITLFANQHESIKDLLKRADLAMYQAKAAGRNTLRFFDLEMQAIATSRAALETELRLAVTGNQLLLFYQAQVDEQGHLTGCEALVRWQHPEHGLMPPAVFIPLAEDTGLILPLGHWVLETACAQLAKWSTQPGLSHLTMAINVSARQFHQADFVAQVLAALEKTGANPQRLKLELTESLLVSNLESAVATMTSLKAQGVGFSLDDFGTGYSSLSYLKRLPLDQLKIDQSFVREILSDHKDAAIAKMIITLGESLGLGVIAEGVETQEQRDALASRGCRVFQGYLFSRPVPVQEFENFAVGV